MRSVRPLCALFLAASALLPMTAQARAFRIPPGMHVDTSVDLASCGGTSLTCETAVMHVLNADRAARHVPPLTLDRAQSDGTPECIGSSGHAVAMARSGAIWHTNSKHPWASFPRSLCHPYNLAAENVGNGGSGTVLDNLKALDGLMMTEPHGKKTCATTVNHACNILNAAYTRVGIGVYVDALGVVWLVEDFTA